MDINFFLIFWIAIVLVFILVGFSTKLEQFSLSRWINELFLYGKEKQLHDQITKTENRPKLVDWLINLQVPKRYFAHFYIFGLFIQLQLLASSFIIDTRSDLFHQLKSLNQLIFGTKSLQFLDSINQFQVNVALVFINLQILRRWFENSRISTFSDSKIHIFHYITGYLFYVSVSLLQFNILFRNRAVQTASIDYLSLISGVVLYSFGSFVQHISLRQLASLRRTKQKTDSKKNDLNHYLPGGFLFELVSCPHYLGELLIYLAICFVLDLYVNALVLFIFVFVIHVPMALQSHDWYHTKFKGKYPKNRKALIPFIL